ncbi:CDP-glycerol glycerophosphotransferase family protein, partial [Staphylococcus xylosus]|uniref:CDP-glycerol glycerophosphotransferase family protein n=2 Tax=Staphylococcus TaxID=1279 RepID=UPI0030C08136
LHPKAKEILEEQFPDMFKIIEPHLYIGNIKNALLESKVVITDYSSVCFYAFAGGSNVIFFWGDKENAEKQYSSQNILQSYNVFGDVTYNMDDHMVNLIENNYNKPQQKYHVSRFKEMVEFTQGNNVENIYKIIKEI